MVTDLCIELLVPEPHAEWLSGDSALDAYLPHVDVAAEVSDLATLARELKRVMGR